MREVVLRVRYKFNEEGNIQESFVSFDQFPKGLTAEQIMKICINVATQCFDAEKSNNPEFSLDNYWDAVNHSMKIMDTFEIIK